MSTKLDGIVKRPDQIKKAFATRKPRAPAAPLVTDEDEGLPELGHWSTGGSPTTTARRLMPRRGRQGSTRTPPIALNTRSGAAARGWPAFQAPQPTRVCQMMGNRRDTRPLEGEDRQAPCAAAYLRNWQPMSREDWKDIDLATLERAQR